MVPALLLDKCILSVFNQDAYTHTKIPLHYIATVLIMLLLLHTLYLYHKPFKQP